MIRIEGVKCPICKERITANSDSELSMNLKTHMASLHQMRELSSPAGERSGGTSYNYPTSRTEAAATTFSGRDESMLGPRAAEQRREATEFRQPRAMETPEERKVRTFRSDKPSESPRYQEEVAQWRYPSATESRTERQATTWSGRDVSRESEESRLRTEEATRWRSPRTEGMGERTEEKMGGMAGMGRMREERHGGGMMHRYTHRRDEMTMSMSCPLCGNNVFGSDDEDLSDELRFHFKDMHRDVMRR